jgi:hypothetical protein
MDSVMSDALLVIQISWEILIDVGPRPDHFSNGWNISLYFASVKFALMLTLSPLFSNTINEFFRREFGGILGNSNCDGYFHPFQHCIWGFQRCHFRFFFRFTSVHGVDSSRIYQFAYHHWTSFLPALLWLLDSAIPWTWSLAFFIKCQLVSVAMVVLLFVRNFLHSLSTGGTFA